MNIIEFSIRILQIAYEMVQCVCLCVVFTFGLLQHDVASGICSSAVRHCAFPIVYDNTTQLNAVANIVMPTERDTNFLFNLFVSFGFAWRGFAFIFCLKNAGNSALTWRWCMSGSRHTHSHIRAAALCLCLRWQTRTSHGKSKLTWREFEIVCQYV